MTTGLCSDVITLSSNDHSPEKLSFIPSLAFSSSFLHGLVYLHAVCLELMSLSIKNAKEQQDQQ